MGHRKGRRKREKELVGERECVEKALKVESCKFSCSFWNDVFCRFKKREGFGFLHVCFTCDHYARFMREMDEEDERMMNEIDEIHRTGAWK